MRWLLLGTPPSSRQSHPVFQTFDVPSAKLMFAIGINDAGQIVGEFTDPKGGTLAFIYAGGTFTTINVPGAKGTAARGINDAGHIVGSYSGTAPLVPEPGLFVLFIVGMLGLGLAYSRTRRENRSV